MNYQVNKFIQECGLLPADVIVAKKIGYRILDHFIVYLGNDYTGHWFMANSMNEGVRYYDENEVVELIEKFEPVKVRKLEGGHHQRQEAIERAVSLEDKPYSLLGSNCEHFANYVQFGLKESPQVGNWIGVGLLALVVGAVAFSKK